MPDPSEAAALEDLRAHAGWMRRLAAALTEDQEAAADLAQDAWVRALERPRRDTAGSLRSWLAGLMLNLSREGRRSEVRRRARAARAGVEAVQQDGWPDPVASAERIELQRKVAEALLSVPEPYRTVLLLHYHDGLCMREIARRQGVAPKTADSQVRRGLDHLRRGLDRVFGDDRKKWLAAMVPLLRGLAPSIAAPQWPSATPGTGSISGAPAPWGILAMSLKLKSALLSLLVVAVGLGLWEFGRWRMDPRPEGEPSRVEAAAARGSEARDPMPAQVQADAPTSRSHVDVPVAAESNAIIRVVDDWTRRTPVPGYTITVTWVSEGTYDPLSASLTGTSDAEGRVVLPRPPQAYSARVEARATATHAGISNMTMGVGGQTSPTVSGAILVYPLVGSAFGTVVDTAGHPVPFAEILLHHDGSVQDTVNPDRIERADATGSFRIERVAMLHGGFTLAAQAPGYCALRRATAGVNQDQDYGPFELLVTESHPLAGRVVDDLGQGVPHARIVVWPAYWQDRLPSPLMGRYADRPQHVLQSDANGAFSLSGLSREPWQVVAQHGDHPMARGSIGPGQESIVLVMQQVDKCHGRVTDTQGQPLEGVRVLLECPGQRFEVRSGSDGGFQCPGAMSGSEGRFVLVKKGYAVLAELLKPVDPSRPPAFTMSLESPLAGRVVWADGRPMPSAEVTLRGPWSISNPGSGATERVEELAGLDSQGTGGDGTFRFDSLYAGQFTLTVKHPETRLPCIVVEVTSGREDLVLREGDGLADCVSFVGIVRDEVTNFPMSDCSVHWEPREPSGGPGRLSGPRQFGWTKSDGSFQLTGIEPVRGVLTIDAPGYAAWATQEQSFAAGEHRVDVVLSPSRGLRLRVVDARGEPLAVDVYVVEREGQYIQLQRERNSGRAWQSRTAHDGRVDLFGLPSSHDVTLEFRFLREDRRLQRPLSALQATEEVQDVVLE